MTFSLLSHSSPPLAHIASSTLPAVSPLLYVYAGSTNALLALLEDASYALPLRGGALSELVQRGLAGKCRPGGRPVDSKIRRCFWVQECSKLTRPWSTWRPRAKPSRLVVLRLPLRLSLFQHPA